MTNNNIDRYSGDYREIDRKPLKPDKMDVGGERGEDLYKKQGLGGWLCHGRGRPMERRGPHAPADHNRGLIMSA